MGEEECVQSLYADVWLGGRLYANGRNEATERSWKEEESQTEGPSTWKDLQARCHELAEQQEKQWKEAQAWFHVLAEQQEKKSQEFQLSFREQNEMLRALVEKKVSIVTQQLQDLVEAQVQDIKDKQKESLKAFVEEKANVLTQQVHASSLRLQEYVRVQVEDLTKSVGGQHVEVNGLEEFHNTILPLQVELDAMRNRLKTAEECSARLQSENKEILSSLQKSRARADVPQEERLASFLEQQQVRSARLASLAGTRVQLTAPLNRSACSRVNPEELRCAVAQAASAYGVGASDVDVYLSEETLQCDVCLRNKGASVVAVVEALAKDLENREHQSGVKKILAGALSNTGKIQIKPRWPLERIQAEIELGYGYTIALQDLEELVSSVSTSFEAYGNAWNKARGKSQQAVDRLTQRESMAFFTDEEATSQFGGTLLSFSEGKRRSLQENWVVQEASNLADVMQDATKAQHQLKSSMAPGTEWCQLVLNDPTSVPYEDPIRVLNSGPGEPLPCGKFFDPGVKGEGRVLEKAKSRMKDLDVEPPVGNLVDVSRLGIVFESAEHLVTAMEWMIENLDLVWLTNKYQSPSCLGYRDMNIGVRQRVPTQGQEHRLHISEVQLLLKDMYDIKQGVGHEAYETIRELLQKYGVKFKDLDKVQQLILRLLDYTDSAIANEAAQNLQYVIENTTKAAMSESAAHMAQALLKQSEKDAMAVGITYEEMQRLKVHSENEAAKKKERKARKEQEAQAQMARLLALERRQDHIQQSLQQSFEKTPDHLINQLYHLEAQTNNALSSMQSAVDNLASESRDSNDRQYQFHKTAIVQIEQTMNSFEDQIGQTMSSFEQRLNQALERESSPTPITLVSRIGGGYDIRSASPERDALGESAAGPALAVARSRRLSPSRPTSAPSPTRPASAVREAIRRERQQMKNTSQKP